MRKPFLVLVMSVALPISAFGATDEKTFQTCKANLKAAKKLDLLYDMQWKPPLEPVVVVGPTYDTLPFDVRENFVLTLNCFFTAGKNDKYINFPILDYKTHKEVARFSWGQLSTD
ncbi:MAG: hypothetical protein ABJA10_02735 [Aestuariivirga sp.]